MKGKNKKEICPNKDVIDSTTETKTR